MYVFIFKVWLAFVCILTNLKHVNIGLDPKEIRGEIPVVNLTKNFASCCQSWRDSWQDRVKIFVTVNLLLGENLGEIRSRIPAEGSHGDFGCQDFCFSARVLARFVAGSWQGFGSRDFCFRQEF